MKIQMVASYAELSDQASEIVAKQIRTVPRTVLGLATGSTPLGMYSRLVWHHRENGLDFSRVVTFNLDEYTELKPNDPHSYHYYMNHYFFRYVNIRHDNIHIPSGDARDLGTECQNYEGSIEQSGGIDLQILGIGSNGHIGFNEPGSDLSSRTRVVTLHESTIVANARFFNSIAQVPRHAISMGIGTISKFAKRILILASGSSKAYAVHELVHGQVTPQIPATFLQLHPDVTLIVDDSAARLLTEHSSAQVEQYR